LQTTYQGITKQEVLVGRMGSNGKFCLRWNDFESNINSAFKELRDEKDFFDVTLACDDEQIQAHKVILAACSPFFRTVLKRNPHQHPLLYLKGVKYTNLQSVLNFMYHGEVNIAQEELNSFLTVAEDLRVKGLTQGPATNQPSNSHVSNSVRPPPSAKQPQYNNEEEVQEVVPIKSEPVSSIPPPEPTMSRPQEHHDIFREESRTSVAAHSLAPHEEEAGYEDYGDYQDQVFNESDISMDQTMTIPTPAEHLKGSGSKMFLNYVEKSETSTGWKCTVCAKESAQKQNLLKHVESVHFPGIFSYECKFCGKTFKAKNNLYFHVSSNHKNNDPLINTLVAL